MKKNKKPTTNYYRTAALLGTQPGYTGGRSLARPHREPVRIPWQLWVLTLIIAAAVLWLWLDPRWYLEATHLEVTGASHETTMAVAHASESLAVHGLWLDPAAITEKVLETAPAVIRIEVVCWIYPAQCTIQVSERTPVLIWQNEQGMAWVDAGGVFFPARTERGDLPHVRGPLPEQDTLPAILEGVAALRRLDVEFETLEYHPRYGLIWSDPHGRRIAFGVGSEMAARWTIYTSLMAQLETRGVFPLVVDLRFPTAPAYATERLW